MFGYFASLLIRPTRTIERICIEQPPIRRIIRFLGGIGIARGILEIVWLFMISGHLAQFWSLSQQPSWYVLEAGPFLAANLTAAYLRWALFTFIAFFLGRSCHGKGDFVTLLRIYGVILGVYAVAIVPNFLHHFWAIPFIRFQVSRVYAPDTGIGQLLSAVWLVFISAKVIRQLHKLPWQESILIGLLIAVFDRVFFLVGARVFFHIPAITVLSGKELFTAASLACIVFSLAFTLLLLWIGRRWKGQFALQGTEK